MVVCCVLAEKGEGTDDGDWGITEFFESKLKGVELATVRLQ